VPADKKAFPGKKQPARRESKIFTGDWIGEPVCRALPHKDSGKMIMENPTVI
jgi:hypothetical protein